MPCMLHASRTTAAATPSSRSTCRSPLPEDMAKLVRSPLKLDQAAKATTTAVVLKNASMSRTLRAISPNTHAPPIGASMARRMPAGSCGERRRRGRRGVPSTRAPARPPRGCRRAALPTSPLRSMRGASRRVSRGARARACRRRSKRRAGWRRRRGSRTARERRARACPRRRRCAASSRRRARARSDSRDRARGPSGPPAGVAPARRASSTQTSSAGRPSSSCRWMPSARVTVRTGPTAAQP